MVPVMCVLVTDGVRGDEYYWVIPDTQEHQWAFEKWLESEDCAGGFPPPAWAKKVNLDHLAFFDPMVNGDLLFEAGDIPDIDAEDM